MTITATRRGFLAGLLGTSVIAVLPKASIAGTTPSLQPYEIAAPDGWTYQWVASHVMGEPTPMNVQARLDSGWAFVAPATHPTVPAVDIARAVDGGGLILMQKESHLVEKPRLATMPGMRGFFEDNRRTFQGRTIGPDTVEIDFRDEDRA